jgi:ABC-type lipoprotein release transport system permease subunit
MIKKTLFNTVIYRGTLAAIYGIVSGLLLGMLIWALLQVSMIVNDSVNIATIGQYANRSYSGAPFEFFVTMGMCFGAVIGSIFGSITALKEQKKK